MPGWLAAIVQVPAETIVATAPLMLHTAGVRVLKVTARPEVAVALTVVVPLTAKAGGEKVRPLMACSALATAMSRVTCVAAAKLALPAWFAAMVQTPEVMPLTTLPAIVQMEGVKLLNVNDIPELVDALALAVPFTDKVDGETLMLPMVWALLETVMSCEVCGAAA